MDSLSTTDAGIIFIGIILILREVFAFVVRKRNGDVFTKDCVKCLRETHQRTRDLHKWHDVRDDEGVPLWYVRKSLEKSIDRLADNVEQQTQVIVDHLSKD